MGYADPPGSPAAGARSSGALPQSFPSPFDVYYEQYPPSRMRHQQQPQVFEVPASASSYMSPPPAAAVHPTKESHLHMHGSCYAAPPIYYQPTLPTSYPPTDALSCGCGLQQTLFIVGFIFPLCWWAAAITYCAQKYKDPRERAAFYANCAMSVVWLGVLIAIIVLLIVNPDVFHCWSFTC